MRQKVTYAGQFLADLPLLCRIAIIPGLLHHGKDSL